MTPCGPPARGLLLEFAEDAVAGQGPAGYLAAVLAAVVWVAEGGLVVDLDSVGAEMVDDSALFLVI